MMEYVFSYISLISNLATCIISYNLLTKEKIIINFKNILILLSLTFISLFTRLFNNGLLILSTNIMFIFIVLKYFYKKNNNKCIYYTIILSIISLISDSLISILINKNYLFNIDIFQKHFYIRALLNIPVCLIILFFCCIPFFRKNINLFYGKYFSKIRYTKTYIFFLILIINILCIAFCINAYQVFNRTGHILILFAIFSFVLLFIIIMCMLYREYNVSQCNKRIIEENNYIKNIAKQDEEFKHNLINNLLGIKTVSTKKTNKLIDELINDYRQDYKNITNINDLPNGVQSIIYRKAYEENIEDLNLIVDNSIEKELYDILSPRKYNHLCTSIGILFDNALEAVRNTSEKVIEISFFEDKNNIYFLIKNSFSNSIDLEEIGKNNFTTKIKGHGIGINFISKLSSLKYKKEIINNMYVSKLIIQKKI